MSLELVLFFVVAAVAIFSAAFMLISRSAVHSALFLVVNLACVAFFYLMLNAPFLAMIQITVYADAIMVLFNAPMPVENHELQAIRMTLAMRDSLSALSLSWRKRGHELGFGAGIAGGIGRPRT